MHIFKLIAYSLTLFYKVLPKIRFQEQSPQKAPPQDLDSEEEFGQEDEGSGGKSDPAVRVTEEAEEKMLLSAVSGTSQCKKNVF